MATTTTSKKNAFMVTSYVTDPRRMSPEELAFITDYEFPEVHRQQSNVLIKKLKKLNEHCNNPKKQSQTISVTFTPEEIEFLHNFRQSAEMPPSITPLVLEASTLVVCNP